jgi:hypothetical protein
VAEVILLLSRAGFRYFIACVEATPPWQYFVQFKRVALRWAELAGGLRVAVNFA